MAAKRAAIQLVKGNAVVGQSGGPTAVINQSLVGVVEALKATLVKRGVVKKVYGMRHGVSGLTKEPAALVDLTRMRPEALRRIAATPSAALGSSRDKPDADYCRRILKACETAHIRYFFYIGGNDSSDTCRIVSEMASAAGYELRCFHVPRRWTTTWWGATTPGYPSAARSAMAFVKLASATPACRGGQRRDGAPQGF